MVANPETTRKPISKRLRFEILRRDNHACRYCGATAPDIKLTVDHVTPVALGGTDEASNLVTACAPCNAGKSASAPDASLVAEVKVDALRHAAVMQSAYAVIVERISLRSDYVDAFLEAWTIQKAFPADFENSLDRWHSMGVPVELIVDAAQKADRCTRRMSTQDRFKYFCGIVWGQVAAVDQLTTDKAFLEGKFVTDAEMNEAVCDAFETGRRWVPKAALEVVDVWS